ncbi:MAG: alpha/beta fold hydrolase [Candidatus Binataceae bacterium]
METRAFCNGKDGVKIRYEVRGQGTPLAMIMGYSASGRAWGEPLLQLLEKRFTTIVIDNRGTGESDKPDQPWTVVDMAADAVAVLDALKLARAHIFGISMGGMIAQELALNFSTRVHGLILGCTNSGMAHAVMGDPAAVASLSPTSDLPLMEQARRALTACCSTGFVASEQGRRFIDERLADLGKYPVTPLHTYARQWDAITKFDTFDRLCAIKASTLVITGSDDTIVPAKNSEILQERIAGAKLHEIKGASHLFFWEAQAETATAVAAFLAAIN